MYSLYITKVAYYQFYCFSSKKMKKIAIITLALAPAIALAQSTLGSILGTIGGLISTATPIVVALALLYFFWGLATYILAGGEEEARAKGKGMMIWGIIALFVIVSIWGLVGILQGTFGVSGGGTTAIPGVL